MTRAMAEDVWKVHQPFNHARKSSGGRAPLVDFTTRPSPSRTIIVGIDCTAYACARFGWRSMSTRTGTKPRSSVSTVASAHVVPFIDWHGPHQSAVKYAITGLLSRRP